MPRTLSTRISGVAPYLFAEIDKAEAAARARGIDVVKLSIGDPDLPTPPFVVEAMQRLTADSKYHRYPPYEGTDFFIATIREYMAARFGADVPEKNILCLVGAKEGIAHLSMGVFDAGDVSINHEPAYPIPATGAAYAGAFIHQCPLLPQNDFLIDFEAIPADVVRRAKMIWVNYPNNPTGATAPRSFYERLVEWALANDVFVVNDLAYSENYFNPSKKPESILSIPGAMDCALEFHSFSKIFNMTGWRLGWCCGNKTLIGALASIKSNHDTSQFGAMQDAAAAGLVHPDAPAWIKANNERMKARRDTVCTALKSCGINVTPPDASLYVWAPLPEGYTDSVAFAAKLLEATGVVIAPGRSYGPSGEGFFRISLTYSEAQIEKGMERLRDFFALK